MSLKAKIRPAGGKSTEFGRSSTEREVLRVLWASPGKHLVRSQIHKRMPQEHRPTLGRVGQILSAMDTAGLLKRKNLKSQGSSKAGFFTLAEPGRELCRQLGFEDEEHQLFDVTDEALRTFLTREQLAREPREAGRIVAVYGWRGRLGRTTLVAHVAKGLAESFGPDQRVLAIDLDLAAPGLDEFFASPETSRCRGLIGLLVDFQRRPPEKRSLWLQSALGNPEYVVQPVPKVPGLSYLPSGLNSDALTVSERAEAMGMLAAAARPTMQLARRDASLKFLDELRPVLAEKFARTVVDTEPGRSEGAWIATQLLAEELILCAQVTDTSRTTLAGLRAVLASFLKRQAQKGGPGGGVSFLFRLTDQTTRDDLDNWIDEHLVLERRISDAAVSYRADQLAYDLRLAEHRRRWENTHFYKHLISRLNPKAKRVVEPSRPELQALSIVLDRKKHPDRRSIAAGVLENAPLQELARWVDWYVEEREKLEETDSFGEDLINNIVNIQAQRLLTKILGRKR